MDDVTAKTLAYKIFEKHLLEGVLTAGEAIGIQIDRMLAIGAGGMDVAVAMGGGTFYLTCPRVIGVKLT